VLVLAVVLLLVANIINLGRIWARWRPRWRCWCRCRRACPRAAMWRALALSVVLEVFVSYARYESILKWTTLSLLAYLAVPFVAHLDWRAVLRGLVVPALGGGRTQAMALVALLGTTISPYLFFWQAGQEVEEQHREHTRPLRLRPRGDARADAAAGGYDGGHGGNACDRAGHHHRHGGHAAPAWHHNGGLG
jgi:hypothetical protein